MQAGHVRATGSESVMVGPLSLGDAVDEPPALNWLFDGPMNPSGDGFRSRPRGRVAQYTPRDYGSIYPRGI